MRDRIAITTPEDEYLAEVETCKHTLHERIVWPKGATPLPVVALCNKLSTLWKSLAKWGITTSLGKGFYELSFSTLEDVRSVRSISSWNLNPGFLKLFPWSKDFNPSMQRQTSAQVWLRIYGLSQEYWRPKNLFAIASSVGTLLCTDAATNKSKFDRTFGHFARVLVDIDLSNELRYKILDERKGFAFFVEVDYENLSYYCNYCKCIGRCFENCKRRSHLEPNQKDKVSLNKKIEMFMFQFKEMVKLLQEIFNW
jgi:hypothetical protein